MTDHIALPHQASAADADTIRNLRPGQLVPPENWHPFGPVDLALWAGPNLAVASRHPRKGWHLHSETEARALLLEHAFGVPNGADRAISRIVPDVPLGTPIAAARTAFQKALPDYRMLDLPDSSTTLFLRFPEAVLCLTAGRYRDLEFVQWVKGEEALALFLRHTDVALGSKPTDTLVVPLSPTEGRKLLQIAVLAALLLLTGPILASPLLLVDAVLWIICIGLVWTIGIFLAPGLLQRWNERRPPRSLRVDPWRVWLPLSLGPASVDRDELTVRLFWRKAFGSSSTQRASARNPDMTVMVLRSATLDLALAYEGKPPANTTLPTMPRELSLITSAEITRDDFWRIAARLGVRLTSTTRTAATDPAQTKGT